MVTRLLTIALIALCAGTVAAAMPQERTDFSGRWTTEAAPAPAPGAGAAPGGGAGQGPGRGRGPARGDMGSGWGPTITITQDAKQLVVEYSVFARGDMQPPWKFVYALDGSATKNTVMMGRGMQAQVSRARWDGAKLTITTEHTLTDPATNKPATARVVQTLSLESPTELAVETVRAGVLGGAETRTLTVYRKL